MTILSGNIKLLQSDTMSDVPEGGGAITGTLVIDGESNNIFDDISTLDRTYGAVHMRKVFPAVQTTTVDRYFGSHVILSKLPGDGKIGVNLFNTGDYFDRRPVAQSRVENYRAQGPIYAGFLWGTQYRGSRAVAIFQSESAPVPGVGDVLLIQTLTTSQYIRVVGMANSVQTFTDVQGPFKRRILEIEISDVLTADFVGSEISRLDTVTPVAKLYKTVVANAARYYSARPLSVAGVLGNLTVKVDSVYSQVVPSSQSELALVDVSAGGSTVPIIDAATGTTSFSTSVSFNAGSTIYLGSPCLPGSLSIPVSGSTLVDEAGNLKSGSTVVGTINYATGILTFGTLSPTYGGSKTVTFRPAAAPVLAADTAAIRVTAANRGYVWTLNLNVPPAPGALSVSYRALNKWYELRDNSNGGLIAEEAGIGSGTVNYTTGSVTLTTSALPDADSDIIFAWGKPADFFNRAGFAPGGLVISHQLAHEAIAPASLVITWNDGVARTITCSASGVLGGYGSGTLKGASGLVKFTPTTLPLGGSTFTFTYSYGTKIEEAFAHPVRSGSNLAITLLNTNLLPNSVEVEWNLLLDASVADPRYLPLDPIKLVHDDGVGGLLGIVGANVNYATGVVTWLPDLTISIPRANFRMGPSTTVQGMVTQAKIFAGFDYVNAPAVYPNDETGWVKIRYRASDTPQSVSETMTWSTVTVDLTDKYAEAIVSGSVRFTFGGRTYVDRNGQLHYNIDPATGSGTYGGTIDYASGVCVLTAWVVGNSPTVGLQSLLTTMNYTPIATLSMRTPAAPLKAGVFQVRATSADGGGVISATADSSGVIATADMQGFVEYETGVVKIAFGAWVAAAGHETEYWYDATAVVSGQIFKPRYVFADSVFYNTVAYAYLPLSAAVLGLDPVRLPADGRVPVYAPGDVVVILHDQTTVGTYTSSSTTDLGRIRLAKLTVRDAAGQALDATKYTANLDTGIITWGSLVGLSQPLKIVDRIEDMAVVSDVQITGTLTLSQPLTHNYPLSGTLVSNAIVYGTLYARTSVPFDQQTWTNVWSGTLIGSSVGAQYNNTQYPIVVDNASCIQERWVIIFTSATVFNVTGEHVGQILTGGTTATDTAPLNPNTGLPYFTLLAWGWGSGWASGNVLRFDTYGANAPTWIIMAIAQGEATDTDYTFCLEFRGDVDTV